MTMPFTTLLRPGVRPRERERQLRTAHSAVPYAAQGRPTFSHARNQLPALSG